MASITFDNKVAGGTGITGQGRAVDYNEIKTVVNLKADQLVAFTVFTGTSWDLTPKNKTLTANLAITISSTARTGLMRLQQDATGSRTFSVNGIAVPILSAANSVTFVYAVYNDLLNGYDILYDTNVVGNVGGGSDTTAPSIVSASIANATPTKLKILYNEPLLTTSIPAISAYSVLRNSGATTISSIAITGSTVELTLSSAALAGQVFEFTYAIPASNQVKDLAGNNAPAQSALYAVTNNVSGGTIAGTTWKTRHDPALQATTNVIGADTFLSYLEDQVVGNSTNYDLVQATQANRPKYIASAINGKPVIEISNGLWISSVTMDTVPTKPITRIAVIQFKAIPSTIKYALYTDGSSQHDFGIWSTNKAFMYTSTDLQSASTLVINTTYVVWCEFRGSGVIDKMYLNGTLEATGSAGGVVSGVPTKVTLGEVTTLSAYAWIGDHMYYEGIMSDADRNSITQELKTKYAIA